MKKIVSIILCLAALAGMLIPTYADTQKQVLSSTKTVLEDGTVVTDEIILYPETRANKTAERKKTFTRNDVVIAIVSFKATYSYSSSIVYVVSKSVTRSDTYDGWNYTQQSFTASGGTVTLSGKLNKLLVLNTSFTMTMTCDKSGNITYT